MTDLLKNDAVILKTISPPSRGEFDKLIRKARRQARDQFVPAEIELFTNNCINPAPDDDNTAR